MDVIASGSWTDAVYLSRDATWDVGDKLLGRADFSGTLLPDGSYTLSLDTTLPGAAAGAGGRGRPGGGSHPANRGRGERPQSPRCRPRCAGRSPRRRAG